MKNEKRSDEITEANRLSSTHGIIGRNRRTKQAHFGPIYLASLEIFTNIRVSIRLFPSFILFHFILHRSVERGWPRFTTSPRRTNSLAWKERRGKKRRGGGEQGREFVPRLSGDNLQNCLARTALFLPADDPRMIIVPRTGTRYVALPLPLPFGEYTQRTMERTSSQLADLPTNTRQPVHAPNI